MSGSARSMAPSACIPAMDTLGSSSGNAGSIGKMPLRPNEISDRAHQPDPIAKTNATTKGR
jgi:hypothetical protein